VAQLGNLADGQREQHPPSTGQGKKNGPSGYAPMDLDAFNGKGNQRDKGSLSNGTRETHSCYICGKQGHLAKNCYHNRNSG